MAKLPRTLRASAAVTFVAVLIALLSQTPATRAVHISLFYPFGSDVGDNILEAGDETSGLADLATPIVFYNTSHNTIYINNNGMVSFRRPLPNYQIGRPMPMQIPDTAIIAAFLADVDTSGAGAVYYRNSEDLPVLNRAAADIRTYFSDYDSFMPASCFIVTWDQVGYYNNQTDKTNRFQLVLTTDGQDSFAVFHYEDDGMQWISSQGKQSPNYNDLPPQAGFDGGRDYNSFLFSSSERPGQFSSESNADIPGLWVYQIGNLGSENVKSSDVATEIVTLFDLDVDPSSCYQEDSLCDANAQCVNVYEESYCCQCVDPFYGNGVKCLEKGKPQVMNGKVTGRINGIPMGEEVQMHTYVVTVDGRTYSAISRVPEQLAGVMQTLTSIGGIGGWLFALKINPRARNGFEFTGAVFNRTSRITFTSQDGRDYVLRVTQVASGYRFYSNNENIQLDTHVEGTLPEIQFDKRVKVDDYHENFKKTGPGTIKSFVARTYRVEDVAYKYTWDNTITFDECGPGAASAEDVMRLSVSKHYSTVARQNMVVRFAMKSQLGVFAGADPCVNAANLCDRRADCVPQGGSYKCVCMPGYIGDGVTCEDVNECELNPCDVNADCYNVDGAFQCRCRPGWEGNGRICRSNRGCGRDICDVNARCVGDSEDPVDGVQCVCERGYRGDGITCSAAVTERSCNEVDICSENAQCVYDEDLREYTCECLDEFSGDGYTCDALEGFTSCDECDRYAFCTENEVTGRYSCDCREGFTGDGRRCTLIDSCRSCSRYATCVFDEELGVYGCQCRRGYVGDGQSCELQDCTEDETLCDPEGGICWFNSRSNSSICRCNYGYRGDGFNCEKVGCDVYNNCDRNAECVTTDGQTYYCRCNEGYEGDGTRGRCSEAVLDPGCDVVNNCAPKAQCVPQTDGAYVCLCNPGYEGDGKTCTPREGAGCDILENCDANAQCFPQTGGGYACMCNVGYEGDGLTCSVKPDAGCDVLENCDRNARCLPQTDRTYACVCNTDYEGDGYYCTLKDVPCNQVNNCDRNAQCLYNPDTMSYQCSCVRGYEGDGIACTKKEIMDCRRDRRLCSENAQCLRGADEAFVCVCEPGYRGDGATCSPVVQEGNYLIYTQASKIMRVSVNADPSDMGQILVYDSEMLAVGVDVDCQGGDLYWTDAARGQILRSKLDGTGVEALITRGLRSPEGIAIDYVAKNIFFTDSRTDALYVSRLDGSSVKTLVNTDMVNPRAIVLDVNRGVIFWTDWNRKRPQIERIHMDGTNRSVLVSEDLGLPNGLAFDSYSQLLCWGDAGVQRIECIRADGEDRRIVYDSARYPFDLALLNNVIYWTDWLQRDIPNVNQNGGELNPAVKLAVGGNGRPYGIVAIKDRCPRGRNSCELENGNCPYLCLPTPRGGRTCECPDGLDPRVCQPQ